MRIIHVIESISPHFGGPPSVVMHLAAAQAALGADVEVVTYREPGNAEWLEHWHRQISASPGVGLQELGRGWRFARRNHRAFRALHRRADIIHVHGIWRPLAWYALSEARSASAAIVLAPHGMLSPWALHHHRFRKMLAFGALWKRLIHAADVLHAVSRGEQDEIAAVISGAHVAMIPNGVSPEETEVLGSRTGVPARVGRAAAGYVLYLARLHAMKGPDLLIDAFAEVVRSDDWCSGYRLIMAGPDFGEKAALEARVRRLNIEDRVEFPGPVFGAAKQDLYRGATLVCQPSRYEAFSLSLLEGAATGIPVLTTPEANFPEVGWNGAGIVCRGEVGELAKNLRRLLGQPDLREQMGRLGRAMVMKNYTWDRIAAGSLRVYEDALVARNGSRWVRAVKVHLFVTTLVASISAPMLSTAASSQPTETQPSSPSFTVFDGLLYRHKPDLRTFGLVPIAGTGNLWRPGVPQDSVDAVQIEAIFKPYSDRSGYFYIDVETWPLVDATPRARAQTISKLARLISLAKQTAPDMHIGFYGLLPGITYWPLVNQEAAGWTDLAMQASYREWRAVDQELESVAPQVDAVFPSLYTFYDDQKGWASYARQTLVEARRYEKPVYAFLWPNYHEGGTPALRGKPVPSDAWRAELELCARYADGVVLWGGYLQDWDPRAPWWLETQSFLAEHHLLAPARSSEPAP